MKRAYAAFGVHGGQRPNPDEFFANPATPESLLKNGLTTAIAMLSDIIMVGTYLVGHMSQSEGIAGVSDTQRLQLPHIGNTYTRGSSRGRHRCAPFGHRQRSSIDIRHSSRDMDLRDALPDFEGRSASS